MSNWNKLWEISNYWDKIMAIPELEERYHKEFLKDLEQFKIDLRCPAVDVGAGAFGGVFNYMDFIGEKIIVDPCATEFKEKYGKIKDGIRLIDAFSYNIPLSDLSMNSVFCIETLDHCNSKEEYTQSVHELIRILAKGGRLYFMLPLRKIPIDGHFISLETISLEEIISPFRRIKADYRILNDHLFLTGVKGERQGE
ncbi:class I SAM-dependent methyltransferase [Candidatus Poribacteria bacterium]|nr:class I SAM-dependent methyltransferase [Candidatus Poribacteria bacterium]